MDRVVWSLMGLAIGDALGAPVEGLKDGHIKQLFGEVTDYVDAIKAFPDRPGKWRLKGLYTDDTQQALALAEVLATQDRADLDALGECYTRLYQEGSRDLPFGGHRGTGHFFRRAVTAMTQPDAEPMDCGQPSAGSGAAMRIAPVGLWYADNPDKLVDEAIRVSLMTHTDPRGIVAAVALARCVAAYAGGTFDASPDAALAIAEELPQWAREAEQHLLHNYRAWLEPRAHPEKHIHDISKILDSLAGLVRECNDQLAADSLVRAGNACSPSTPIANPQAGFAPVSVPMALYRALSARDFQNGLIGTINAGGDTDTVGAMVGGVLGARFGGEAIPEEWIKGLVNAEQVRVRAEALRDRGMDWSAWEEYVAMELALTEREEEALAGARGKNRKAIEKREEKRTAQQAQAEKKKIQQQDETGFAPPPEVWLGEDEKPQDPIEAKKERARRGRKRIDWKEDRRRQNRRRDSDSDSDED